MSNRRRTLSTSNPLSSYQPCLESSICVKRTMSDGAEKLSCRVAISNGQRVDIDESDLVNSEYCRGEDLLP